MLNRLVAPVGFIVTLMALAFVIQTLGNSRPANKALIGSKLLKQYEVVEVTPPLAIVTDQNNKKIDLRLQLTKPTLITFWSVNCGQCDIGLPILDNFTKDQNQIELILINTKDEPKDSQEKLQSLGVTLGTFYDLDGSIFRNWEATMPASYYVVNGKVKYFFPGRIAKDHLDALSTGEYPQSK